MEKQIIKAGPHQVVCQKWEESERGWGVRPDGFSLHLSHDGLRKYIKEYWDGMPDEAPDEYSRPSGTPYEVGVAEEVVVKIERNGGLRYYSNQYLGSGGADGRRTMR